MDYLPINNELRSPNRKTVYNIYIYVYVKLIFKLVLGDDGQVVYDQKP